MTIGQPVGDGQAPTTEQIFQFFFPRAQFGDFPPPSDAADNLAAQMFWDAIVAARRQSMVPMPPTSPPDFGWLVQSAVEAAWNAFKYDNSIPQDVYNVVRSNYRSTYEMLKNGIDPNNPNQ